MTDELNKPDDYSEQEWEELTIRQKLWVTSSIEKYGSVKEARRIRSEAGKKGKGISKKSHLSGNSEKASEIGKKGSQARWGKESIK